MSAEERKTQANAAEQLMLAHIAFLTQMYVYDTSKYLAMVLFKLQDRMWCNQTNGCEEEGKQSKAWVMILNEQLY